MRKILIVDDEAQFRKRFRRLLKGAGLKTVEAPDAVDVANVLMREKSDLDLILLDINIKEVDGRDIFEIVDEYSPSIPIIVTSVLPVSEQKLRIPRVADYFNKAEKDESLLKKVKTVLGVEEEA